MPVTKVRKLDVFQSKVLNLPSEIQKSNTIESIFQWCYVVVALNLEHQKASIKIILG